MPDYTGRLSEEEYSFVENRLTQLRPGLNSRCPMSGSRDWIIGNYLVYTPTHEGQHPTVGGPDYVYVQVICQTCGYTMFFNGVMIGLLPGTG